MYRVAMSVIFFGPRWDAPMLDQASAVETPVGKPCLTCRRLIEPGDQGVVLPVGGLNSVVFAPIHRGCEMATTVGHIFGLCSCTGWNDVYERGQELVRRDEAGTLVPVG